jgi:hypothetical protein
MKPIEVTVHYFYPAMQAADVPVQPRYLFMKRANLGNQSGDQIACVLAISNGSRLGHPVRVLFSVGKRTSRLSVRATRGLEYRESIWSWAACRRVTITALIRFSSS